jgi:hypothetical protein
MPSFDYVKTNQLILLMSIPDRAVGYGAILQKKKDKTTNFFHIS